MASSAAVGETTKPDLIGSTSAADRSGERKDKEHTEGRAAGSEDYVSEMMGRLRLTQENCDLLFFLHFSSYFP
jgi:hypothetical protein